MDQNSKSSEVKNVEIEQIVEKCIKRHADGMEYSKEVLSKFSDITLSYVTYLIKESTQIADLKNAKNVGGDDVKIALDTISRKTNLITDKDVESNTKDLIPQIRVHKLNTDDCKLKSISVNIRGISIKCPCPPNATLDQQT